VAAVAASGGRRVFVRGTVFQGSFFRGSFFRGSFFRGAIVRLRARWRRRADGDRHAAGDVRRFTGVLDAPGDVLVRVAVRGVFAVVRSAAIAVFAAIIVFAGVAIFAGGRFAGVRGALCAARQRELPTGIAGGTAAGR
jgi:hypothetical protein